MAISAFDLFSIGLGPSSSHTVGPMRAAARFGEEIKKEGHLSKAFSVKVDLYGSLALTGKGHATDLAVILGLAGHYPDGIEPQDARDWVKEVRETHQIPLSGEKKIPFEESRDIIFHMDKQLPFHPNGMRFTLYGMDKRELTSKVFYSVGGGFIVDHEAAKQDAHLIENHHSLPYPFHSGQELLEKCKEHNLSIAQLMMENEKSWRTEEEVKKGLLKIWHVMKACVDRGCHETGILPGGLNVRRRAASLYQHLIDPNRIHNPSEVMEWVSLWALAVNEENAAGGRVVTAPTNGAAGVIPAVLHYYEKFHTDANEDGIVDFFLVAAAMGILYKLNASISAAEMGCMGEVGVACSMAAAALTAVSGGSNQQVENAAEIGMEHNLGLTCDPIMGLVQIPCIERNTMGAVKAINAMLLAMRGDGIHRVSLDQVIATMKETGNNMKSIYKETSLGGLAVNVPEC